MSNEDLIDKFKNILIKYSDTPEEFAEAGGYSVISATAGRFFKSKYEFKGRPNTWIIISSIPGRMRRSTVLEAVDYVINRVNRALLSEWQSKQPKETSKKETGKKEADKKQSLVEQLNEMVDNSIIEDGSAEGITDQIESSDLDTYHISNEEFGCTLQEAYGQGYKSGVKVLLSKLYDGNACKVALSQRGGKKGMRRIRKGLYVTLFCGMQEVNMYITPFAIRQGVQRRIFVIYVPVNKRHMPYLNSERAMFWIELKNYADELIEYVKECAKGATENKKVKSDNNFVNILWDNNVDDEVNKIDDEVCKAVDVLKPALKDIAKLSFGQHLAKLCMCKAIAKQKIIDYSDMQTAIVGMDSLKEASDFMTRVGNSADLEYEKIGMSETSKAWKTTNMQEPKGLILDFIGKHMPDGVVRSEITLKFKNNMSAEEITKLIEELISTFEIEVVQVPTDGRPKTVIRLKEQK